MTEPSPNPLPPTAFAVDCDRTLTGDDLVPDPQALAAIAALREAGIRCILVTGRSKADLERHPGIATGFDAYALEGGAEWGTWTDLLRPSNVDLLLQAADRVVAAGIPIERRAVSFGVAVEDRAAVESLIGACTLEVNRDRLDILPPGLDKGIGLDGALGAIGYRAAHVVAIGDGENDEAMFARAAVALAVGNAVPAIKDLADEVLPEHGPQAVVAAARRLLSGEWRTPSSLPAAA
jgi:hypothetical protein